MRRAIPGDHLLAELIQIDGPAVQLHRTPHRPQREVDQIVDQPNARFGAGLDHGYRFDRAGVLLRHKMGRHADAIQGVAQVVAEYRQEHLPRLFDALVVTADGCGERLIHQFAEAGDVVNVVQVRLRKTLSPQAQHGRAARGIRPQPL